MTGPSNTASTSASGATTPSARPPAVPSESATSKRSSPDCKTTYTNVPPGSTQDNTTLDEMPLTFLLNQTLYFDFSHDTNIMSVLTAFGLTQFAPELPPTGPSANQQLIVSHLEPFGARLVIEIIKAPQPLSSKRPTSPNATMSDYYEKGGPTTYVHFQQNQRTIPLGKSYSQCGMRDDGWCEATAFIGVLEQQLAKARYNFSCNGNYPAVPYGTVTDGAPVQSG